MSRWSETAGMWSTERALIHYLLSDPSEWPHKLAHAFQTGQTFPNGLYSRSASVKPKQCDRPLRPDGQNPAMPKIYK